MTAKLWLQSGRRVALQSARNLGRGRSLVNSLLSIPRRFWSFAVNHWNKTQNDRETRSFSSDPRHVVTLRGIAGAGNASFTAWHAWQGASAAGNRRRQPARRLRDPLGITAMRWLTMQGDYIVRAQGCSRPREPVRRAPRSTGPATGRGLAQSRLFDEIDGDDIAWTCTMPLRQRCADPSGRAVAGTVPSACPVPMSPNPDAATPSRIEPPQDRRRGVTPIQIRGAPWACSPQRPLPNCDQPPPAQNTIRSLDMIPACIVRPGRAAPVFHATGTGQPHTGRFCGLGENRPLLTRRSRVRKIVCMKYA